MRTYLKYLIYYSLAFLDATVNLFCSFVRAYPGMETAENYLMKMEVVKTRKFIDGRGEKRQQMSEEAEDKLDQAKSMFNGL